MQELIDYTAGVVPNNRWDDLRSLDYRQDTIILRSWLATLLTREAPAVGVVAYWFGIFNPIVNDTDSCGFYVSGSRERYKPGSDWACWKPGAYVPQGRYAPSQVLPLLYRTAINVEDPERLGEYTLCLGYVCLVVADLVRYLDPPLLVGKATERTVAVGFDSGDQIFLGSLTSTGWSPAVSNPR